LVLDPKNSPDLNGEQAAPEGRLRPNSDLSQSDRPDTSMEITAERIRDVVSDPSYPSFEILLDVAGKLLDSFEK
jgi:hypothetical protein